MGNVGEEIGESPPSSPTKEASRGGVERLATTGRREAENGEQLKSGLHAERRSN